MFSLRHAYVGLAVFVLLVASIIPDLAESIEPPDDGALRHDATAYADHFNVSVEEAIRRLQIQKPAGELNAMLEEGEADTFAGLWIQHEPEFKIIVRFTRNGSETIDPYVESGPLTELVEVGPAIRTVAELRADQAAILRRTKSIPIRADSEINVFENRVELRVVDEAQFNAALSAVGIYLPDSVAVVTVDALLVPLVMYGGLALDSPVCTTGFSVLDNNGNRGVTTAAHCGGVGTGASYQGSQLPLMGERHELNYDVQWHTTPGFDVENWAYDGLYDTSTPAYRTITQTRSRNFQAIGEWVCKYGRSTGLDCGEIVAKDVVGLDANGQPTLAPTFIRIYRAGVTMGLQGDSGGPVYYNNIAYGIIHAGSGGNDVVYVPINYVGGLGVFVLLY